MLRFVLLASICCLLASCAAPGVRSASPTWTYEELIAQPTPAAWRPGATWTFVLTTSKRKTRTLTFRVTDDPIKTCLSGSWRRLQLLQDSGPAQYAPKNVAYETAGSFLSIDLLAGWCDVDNLIQGQLSEKQFSGEQTTTARPVATVFGTLVP
jgi:hypothetical protein